MTTFSLDDLEGSSPSSKSKARPKKPKVKPKSTSVKAKTSTKKPKGAKVVSGKKVTVKKRKKDKTKPEPDEQVRKKDITPANVLAEDSTMLSTLETQMGDLVDSIPDVVRQENEQIQEYLLMFENCRELARIAEDIYREKKQSRDVYPIMQLYNQMREIIADLRALRDVGQMGDVLNDEVISPLMQSNGAALVQLRQTMVSYFKSNLQTEEIGPAISMLNQAVTKAANEFQNSYHDSLNKTVLVFNGGA